MSMSCKIAADIAELYYEDLLSPETKKAVQRHLGGCQHCREYYRQYETVRKQKAFPVLPALTPEDEISETEKRLYTNISEKLRRRRFWQIFGISAAVGAGSVMLTIGLLLTCHKNTES